MFTCVILVVDAFSLTALSGNTIYGMRRRPDPEVHPDLSFAALIYVPGGINPGRQWPLGREATLLARAGMVALSFNAEGRIDDSGQDILSGGSNDYNGFRNQDRLLALVQYAADLDCVDDDNTGLYSMTFGISMAAGCAGRYPEAPIKCLFDAEGPATWPSGRSARSIASSPASGEVICVYRRNGITRSRLRRKPRSTRLDSHRTGGSNYVHGVDFRTTELRVRRDRARALAIVAAKEKAEAWPVNSIERSGARGQLARAAWTGRPPTPFGGRAGWRDVSKRGSECRFVRCRPRGSHDAGFDIGDGSGFSDLRACRRDRQSRHIGPPCYDLYLQSVYDTPTGGERQSMIRIHPVVALLICLAATIVTATILIGCGEDGSTNPPDGSKDPLVFTREDSSVVEFSSSVETYIWCGDWSAEEVPVASLHVWVGTPTQRQTYWYLRAVLSDVAIGAPMPFPNYFIWNEPDSVSIFLFDPPNELATDTEESSGTIVFHQLPCPTGTSVDFTLDAVMGSEYGDLPTVAVRGRFEGQITGAPPWRTSRNPESAIGAQCR